MKRETQDVTGRKYIKNTTGEIKVNEKEIMERLTDYFSEFLNEQSEFQLDEEAKVEGQLKEFIE